MTQSFVSTRGHCSPAALSEAVLRALPADNGLYVPTKIPQLPKEFFQSLPEMTLVEMGQAVTQAFLGELLPKEFLDSFVEEAINFQAPLIEVDEGIFCQELFHGPTLAFKDFGARFMARLMGHFAKDLKEGLCILAATSGDTGSAVAHGFLGVEGIRVLVLYPKGKVSPLQEKQMCCLGQNIETYAVDGTFDDCQRMVKEAFLDPNLSKEHQLTSANSINIARLIPQTFYYFYAYSQLPQPGLRIAVPCGNLGNLCAGLLAKKMGLPLGRFIAATNQNDVFCHFLKTGRFEPHPSQHSLSNAMDVGNPSNLARILYLFQNDLEQIRRNVEGQSVSDEKTLQIIEQVAGKSGYIMDPHGAVAYKALRDLEGRGVFLGTAHPAKFLEAFSDQLKNKINIPSDLQRLLGEELLSQDLDPTLEALRSVLNS